MKQLLATLCVCLLLSGCGASPAVTPTTFSSGPSQESSGFESSSTLDGISQPVSTVSSENSVNSSALSSSASSSEPSKTPSAVQNTSSATSWVENNPTENSATPSAPSTATPETLHITKGGNYSLSGEKKDVMITVDAGDDVVTLTLAGATVTNSGGPALYIASAKQVNLIVKAGTKNVLSDGSSYSLTDGTTTLDATLFSRSDLHISGGGSLEIKGNYKHGLVSKDDLEIQSGTYQITAKNVALEGKDCVKISGGNFTLNAGSDGIRATNIERADKGFVEIGGGTFAVTAGNDSIQATTNITVTGGEFTLRAGQSGWQAEGTYRQTGGTVTIFGTLGSGKALLNAKTAAIIEGGSFFAFGDGSKLKHFTNVNGGCALLLPFANQSAGTPFTLTKGGTQVVNITPSVGYGMALVYTSALTNGEYTVTLGSKTHTFTVNTPIFTLQ